MIQWLNVRAVGAIKARPFEERTPLPVLIPSPHCLFLFLSLSSSSFASRRQPQRRPGWRADAQGLSLRLGPPCQPGGLFLPSPTLHAPSPLPFRSEERGISLSLSPTVVLVPRPAKTFQSRLHSFSPTRHDSDAVTQSHSWAEWKPAGGPSSFSPHFLLGEVKILNSTSLNFRTSLNHGATLGRFYQQSRFSLLHTLSVSIWIDAKVCVYDLK